MANASKKTEEELLQETFQNFRTQTDTEEPATESSSGGGGSAGGAKSNKNLVPVFIVGGLVATGLLGYVLVIKPMLQPAPVQMVQEQQNNEVQQPQQDSLAQFNNQVQAPAPVEVAPTQAPTVPAQTPVVPAPAPVQAPVPSLESFQVEVAAIPAYTPPVVQAPAPAPAEVAPAPAPTVPVQTPVVPAPVEVVPSPSPVVADPVVPTQVDVAVMPSYTPPVEANPVTSTRVDITPVATPTNASEVVVNDLVTKFDNQTNEFKSLIGGLDTRVTVLEGKFAQQEGVNKEFDSRITALEKGKVDKKGVNNVKSSTNSTEQKTTSVKSTSEKKVRQTVRNNEERVSKKVIVDDGSILVDKNGGKRVQPEDIAKEVKKPVAQKEVLPQLKIHSIYGSRMWITNPNGTLSTYTEGNVLPTGEIIKEINDATFTIVTNKRKIVKE